MSLLLWYKLNDNAASTAMNNVARAMEGCLARQQECKDEQLRTESS
jgi:hypothetical protein